MARSDSDVAIINGTLGGTYPNDAATTKIAPPSDYTKFLKTDGLKGARIGIPRTNYYDKTKAPGSDKDRGGLNPDQTKAMAEAMDILTQHGAVVIGPADIPSISDEDPNNNLVLWGVCTDMAERKNKKCSVVPAYGT